MLCNRYYISTRCRIYEGLDVNVSIESVWMHRKEGGEMNVQSVISYTLVGLTGLCFLTGISFLRREGGN